MTKGPLGDALLDLLARHPKAQARPAQPYGVRGWLVEEEPTWTEAELKPATAERGQAREREAAMAPKGTDAPRRMG